MFGAAIASVIAQLFAFLFCFARIAKVPLAKIQRGDWMLDARLAKDMLTFALPISLQMMVIAAGGMVAQSVVNQQGSAFVAGCTAMNKTYGLLESTAILLGMAAATFFAQNFGAGEKARVRAGVRTSAAISVALSICVTALMLFAGRFVLQMFIDPTEAGAAESLDVGYRFLMVASCALVVLYLIHVFRNALQALGNSTWSMASGFAECAVRIAMAKGATAALGSDVL